MIIKSILFFITTLFFIGCTTHHLNKYDNFPCQGRVFELNKDKIHIVNNKSIMREGYYYISRNSLEPYINSKEQYVPSSLLDSIILKGIYPKGTQFKVIGYYVAYDTTTIPLPGGGRAPNYLVQSLKDKEIFWIQDFELDIDSCSMRHNIMAKTFIPYSNNCDINFTVIELDLDEMQKRPFE